MDTQGFLNNQFAMSMVDASPDAVLLVDTDGVIRLANQRACELFRYDSDHLIGTSVERLISPEARDRHVSHRESYTRRPVLRPMGTGLELHGLRSDGSRFPAEIGIGPVDADGSTMIVCTVRDITEHRDIEAKLRASEYLLLEAQRVAHIGSWHWDLRTEEVRWSDEIFRVFGLPGFDRPLTYAEIQTWIHPEDRPDVDRAIAETRAGGSPFSVEFRITRGDDRDRYVLSNGVLNTDEQGRAVSMIGTVQDITERKQIEQNAIQLAVAQAARDEAERMREQFEFLEMFSSTLASSLDVNETLNAVASLIIPRLADWTAINVISDDEQIQRPAVRHRTSEGQAILEAIRERGYFPSLDSDHPLAVAMRSGEPQLHRQVTDEMTRSMAGSAEHLQLSRALGACSIVMVPLLARGRAYGVMTLGMSVSGRTYDDDDFALAREVAQRAAIAIDNANLYRASEQAAQFRQELVALVSHELKTPLTVIKGHAQILGRYLSSDTWDQRKILKVRERLAEQIERLELLISDILDVSRVHQGRLDLQLKREVDVAALAANVLAQFDDLTDMTDRHRLVLDAPEPVLASADPLRLDQVLSNLISNAIKYSPDGGEVRVGVRRCDGHVVISVEDQGVGISQEDQRGLFIPFHRGQASKRGISGTGLGLYIARQIIEQHGGEIEVASEAGRGTRFTARVPLEPRVVE